MKLKNIFLASVVAFVSFGINAQSAAELANLGDEAYAAKEYETAVELYRQALAEGESSSNLFYNLGNALYRSDDISGAIISYERALRIDPTNSDARTNLEFVNQKIGITSPMPSYSSVVIGKALQTMSANAWAVTALVVFVIVLVLAAGYIFGRSIKFRKICFFTGLIALFIDAALIYIAVEAPSQLRNNNQAVVTAVSTILSTSPATPTDQSQQAFLLREGSKVEILDSVATPLDQSAPLWYEVKADEDHRAWINASHVEKI